MTDVAKGRMLSRKVDPPLTVQVPSPAQDRPSWRMVAIIAAAGFLVGVVWPRLAGVRLGPSLPEGVSTAASASAVPGPVEAVLPSAPQAAAAAASTVAPLVPPVASVPSSGPATTPVSGGSTSPPTVSVAPGVVMSCKTADGELKPADCPKVAALDGLVRFRLRKLADCPEAGDARGRVQFVMHIEFARGWLSIELGRGHGVPPATAESILLCARSDLSGAPIASMAPVAHDHSRYTVGYSVTFAAPARSTPEAVPSSRVLGAGAGADDEAQIVWEVGLVRDAPKTGKILARLPRGATVRLGPVKDGWYPARYGDGFGESGWLYRGAVGR